MIVIGLTGSIGMGKSTTAALFGRAGVSVHDADATVHVLYRGAAVPLIEAAFPGTVVDGVVQRGELGQRVLGHPEALARLEAIVHPLVHAAEAEFLRAAAARGERVTVLDIPLLLETGGDTRVDVVLVVTAPAAVQRARVLARAGMTEERFESIVARQMPDAIKRQKAHFCVDTGRGLDAAAEQVAGILRVAMQMSGRSRT